MLFADLAATSDDLASSGRRTDKRDRLAATLRSVARHDLPAAVTFLSGEIPGGSVGVGFAALRDVTAPAADDASLTIRDVSRMLDGVRSTTGAGSKTARREALVGLLAAATAPEQDLLRGLLGGGVRQGALQGIMIEAIAEAFGADPALVRRALMLSGDIGRVATSAAAGGDVDLALYRLSLFSPLQPMLASTAPTASEAVAEMGLSTVEWKLDGVRLQIHCSDGEVRTYTRNLKEATDRLPEVVATVGSLPVSSVVLDAEAILLRPDGRPRAFQETMGRFGRGGLPDAQPDLPMIIFVFDCLHLDGDDLIDLPLEKRLVRMSDVIPPDLEVPRIVTDDPVAATSFFDSAVAAGHEGVVVKALGSRYQAGRRGSEWVKVKTVHTLDLVVLAAEWGSGRRRGLLSNLHLGAFDPTSGDFVMLGKTFKGLTDEMLRWQTERFQELETHRERHVVHVRPEQVVEIAFDGVQASSRYPGGMALRFARVKGYRQDKAGSDADTIGAVRAIFERSRNGGDDRSADPG
ncbi:MAG: ATP-dependent DNA ligase [Acidimicrobiia bacterium]